MGSYPAAWLRSFGRHKWVGYANFGLWSGEGRYRGPKIARLAVACVHFEPPGKIDAGTLISVTVAVFAYSGIKTRRSGVKNHRKIMQKPATLGHRGIREMSDSYVCLCLRVQICHFWVMRSDIFSGDRTHALLCHFGHHLSFS